VDVDSLTMEKAETDEQRVQRVLKEEIVIQPYDSRWLGRFREEETHLRAVRKRGQIAVFLSCEGGHGLEGQRCWQD